MIEILLVVLFMAGCIYYEYKKVSVIESATERKSRLMNDTTVRNVTRQQNGGGFPHHCPHCGHDNLFYPITSYELNYIPGDQLVRCLRCHRSYYIDGCRIGRSEEDEALFRSEQTWCDYVTEHNFSDVFDIVISHLNALPSEGLKHVELDVTDHAIVITCQYVALVKGDLYSTERRNVVATFPREHMPHACADKLFRQRLRKAIDENTGFKAGEEFFTLIGF